MFKLEFLLSFLKKGPKIHSKVFLTANFNLGENFGKAITK